MPLAPGARLGAYEIVSLLGAGGMGEVYRARDTRLQRDVAIKVLPDAFVHDADRLARFKREAQVLASLNHPHIAAIYGLEEGANGSALVLELVEGLTLADRIARGPIPVDEAIAIARQIAEALEAAHELGIIHRDLKPSNIKVTADDKVKVLDFGLAKALDTSTVGRDFSGADASISPTITSPAMTMGGVILGTAAYMSPEQARGKVVDKRTDIWAFGCLLFEMLTGQPPFSGEDVTLTLSKILQRDVEWTALPPSAPANIRHLLRRCLEKDRQQRLADIADARYELEHRRTEEAPPARRGLRPWPFAAIVVAALLGTMAGAFVMRSRTPPAEPAPSVRFQLNLPPGVTDIGTVAVSPDGRYLVFSGRSSASPSSLWLHPLATMSARALPGTDGASSPVWSPDSRFVAFWSAGSLKRVEISSGDVSTMASGGYGSLSWGANDTLLFSRAGALHRISATGSGAAVVARPEGDASFGLPSFFPDGDRFLFADIRTLVPQRGAATIYAGSLTSGGRKELLRADSAAVYANRHVLFVRDRTLMAQPFDMASMTLAGDPVAVAENLSPGTLGTPYFSASQTGVLAFPVQDTAPSQLVWLDRAGTRLATVTEPGDYSNPRVSPDGKKVAVCIYDQQARSRDIWVLELARGTRTRLTHDPADDMNPAWSPDSMSVVFSSDRKGQRDLYRKSLGGGDDQLIYTSGAPKSVSDWSPDGRQVIFNGPQRAGAGISFIDPAAPGGVGPVSWLTSPFNAGNGQFSPDGRWVAFSATDTGRNEIYVAPVSGAGGKIIVSTTGGIQPRWSRDGTEMYYLTSQRDKLMVVPVSTRGTFEAGSVRELMQLDVANALGYLYDVSPDGRRFLVNVRAGERIAPITVVLNWFADIQK